MHIKRVDGNQRRDLARVGENVLSHGPRLDWCVIAGKQQRTFQSVAFAETCNAHQIIDVLGGIRIARDGREYAKSDPGHGYRSSAALAACGRLHPSALIGRASPRTPSSIRP